MSIRLVVPEPVIYNQGTNGDDVISGHRNTDASPTGTFLRFQNSTSSTDLFTVDITGTILSGIIPTSLFSGTLAAGQFPALTGDLTGTAGTLAVTVAKVNGVVYPASPSTNTVPVVTGTNQITYQTLSANSIAGGQVVKTLAANSPLSVSGATDAVTISIAAATTAAMGVVRVGSGLNVSSGLLTVAYGSTASTAVAGNTTVTVTAGTGLSGGGTLTLGSGGTVTLTNAGVTSIAGTTNEIVASSGTGNIVLSFPAGGATLPGRTSLSASTATGASLNIPTGVAPTTPAEGDLWQINTAGIYSYYNGGTHLLSDLDSTQTFTNKSISGSTNTLTNVPNSALTNNSLTVSAGSGLSGGGTVALGGSTSISLNVGNANTWTALQTYTNSVAIGASAAATGDLRFKNSPVIAMRNGAGSADINLLSVDSAGNGTWSQNFIVGGDLTVQGSMTTISSSNLSVSDQNITLNQGGTIASAATAGLDIYASDAYAPNTYTTLRVDNGRWQAPASAATTAATYGTLHNIALVGVGDVVDSLAGSGAISVSGATGAVTVSVADAASGAKGVVQLTGDFGGTATAPLVKGINGTLLSLGTLSSGQVLQYNGTNWVNGTINTVNDWNELTNPVANQVLNMGSFYTSWTWGSATGSGQSMFILTDTTSNSGTGAILNVSSAASSAAKPVQFTANGTANGVYMDTTGNLLPMGTGKISANVYTSVLPITNGGTGQTTKAAAYNALSPMTTLGDIEYFDGTNGVRLAANTTATHKYLQSVSSGAPTWQQIAFSDLSGSATAAQLPIATTSALGIVQLAGDLGGTDTAPSVLKIDGVAVSGSAAANTVLVASGTAAASWTTVPNAALAHSSVTVTAGTGLSGGGAVSLGSSITLTNIGLLSATSSDSSINVSVTSGALNVTLPQSVSTTSSPTFSTITLTGKPTAIHGSSTQGYYGTTTDVADSSDTLLTTTAATTVATFTPATKGNFIIYLYYRIVTAPTNLNITISWSDGSGAQSMAAVAGLQSASSYTMVPVYINATSSSAIIVSATAGTANQVYISSSIVGC